jgi:hypothetical protein
VTIRDSPLDCSTFYRPKPFRSSATTLSWLSTYVITIPVGFTGLGRVRRRNTGRGNGSFLFVLLFVLLLFLLFLWLSFFLSLFLGFVQWWLVIVVWWNRADRLHPPDREKPGGRAINNPRCLLSLWSLRPSHPTSWWCCCLVAPQPPPPLDSVDDDENSCCQPQQQQQLQDSS